MTADPRTVLCFGDSLTWGFDPRGGENIVRYAFGERWTRRLQAELGESYHVIEDGLSGCRYSASQWRRRVTMQAVLRYEWSLAPASQRAGSGRGWQTCSIEILAAQA